MYIVLSKNSKEIRNILTNYGFDLCICCNFKDACWLTWSEISQKIHGLGYWDETVESPQHPMTQEKMLKWYFDEVSEPVLVFNNVEEFVKEVLKTYKPVAQGSKI